MAFAARDKPRPPIDLLGLATAAAVAMDVAAELRLELASGDLVAIARVQKPDHAGDLIDSLRGAGVPAVARGTFHRTLLQFFGPFIPIDILVPAAQAAQGGAVFSSQVQGAASEPVSGSDQRGSTCS